MTRNADHDAADPTHANRDATGATPAGRNAADSSLAGSAAPDSGSAGRNAADPSLAGSAAPDSGSAGRNAADPGPAGRDAAGSVRAQRDAAGPTHAARYAAGPTHAERDAAGRVSTPPAPSSTPDFSDISEMSPGKDALKDGPRREGVRERAIVVAGLRVRLEKTLIVDGVDLDVGVGEWVTVIGPNGAGKSTALRAIGGLLPFEGVVELNGVAVDKLHRRERAKTIATVAQSPVVPPAMRVFDYVLLGRTPYVPPLGRESAADLATVDDVLGALDLDRFAGRRLDTLSGGERQRVFLARALAQGARILLLDEPTSALDIGHQQEVLELVDRLRAERGLTVLATMHDLTTAGEYADRMVLLAAGKVMAAGTPRDVLTEDNLAEHYRVRVRVIEGDHGPLVVPVRAT